jgi:F-type H+-transporting ATPase subunit delta
MAKLIAKTYGDALFELAVEKGKTAEFLDEFTAVCDALAANPEFGRLMNHPKILKDEKAEVLANVFKGRVSDEITGFLEILITKDRFGDIGAIYDYFSAVVKDSLGIGVARVSTANPLNEVQKTHITDRLLEVTDYKKMEMTFVVDEKLIGGMVIRIGDRVMDASIATSLYNMKKRLSNVQI